MTKHRRTKKRGQKGGFFGFWESSNQPSQESWFSWLGFKTKEASDKLNTGIGSFASNVTDTAKSGFSSITETANSVNPFSSSDTENVNMGPTNGVNNTYENSNNNNYENSNNNYDNNNNNYSSMENGSMMGGKRRKHCRSIKSKKGGSSLADYAAPVSGLNVAQPTSWQFYANGVNQYSVKGGLRKRRSRKNRRSRRKTR